MIPKIIATDIDGVWTDAGMYYTENGDEIKKFNTYDSAGVAFSQKLGITVMIVTGENSVSVKNRAKKLKIDHCYTGVSNKLELVSRVCKEKSIDLSEVAYIGDDLNDIELLKVVGFSACPSSAPHYIKRIVHKVMQKEGGDGVFREFVEHILAENNQLEQLLKESYFL